MKKIILLVGFILTIVCGRSQGNVQASIQKSCDSLFNLLITEKNDDKKTDLILKFYLTSIDGFPVMVLDLGQRLLQLAEKRKDIIIESSGWTALGQGHRLTGNYVKALEMHRKGVMLAEQSGNERLISFAINQMGHIYKDRLENDKALSLYIQAARYAEHKTGVGMWFPYMNMATVYLNMGNMDSSMFYARKALTIVGAAPNLSNHAVIAFTIGGIYSHRGDTVNARKYFDSAIAIAAQSRSPRYLNSSYLALAEHFYLYKKYDSAAIYCKMALDAVKNTASANLALKPARMLIDYYQDKNPDSTVKFWRVYATANDSLNSARANQQIQMLTFEEDQRKRDIETENIKYRNKVRTGMLLVGLGLFSLVAVVLFRNNRQKQKTNLTLKKTLVELQTTQKQLVQSEKMASLGELTAGIAHEIQNPLNFVNNFSEVNKELADELKEELAAGNLQSANELADDIRDNSEKINHHGKRADAIVKGMLQHSRSSSGQKEPTDINALCDEYLRLSYHGLRAKDKSFNATIHTNFDPSIEKINIIPQDIGRVVMNLLTNAFYAVNQRRQNPGGLASYEPTVTITTSRLTGNNPRSVLITVADNGTGIPSGIADKIFQPFFTTKPTGQGTGLGLSLAYDIVKAHGGTIMLENSSEGATFKIELLVN